jgi:hypothetical protein
MADHRIVSSHADYRIIELDMSVGRNKEEITTSSSQSLSGSYFTVLKSWSLDVKFYFDSTANPPIDTFNFGEYNQRFEKVYMSNLPGIDPTRKVVIMIADKKIGEFGEPVAYLVDMMNQLHMELKGTGSPCTMRKYTVTNGANAVDLDGEREFNPLAYFNKQYTVTFWNAQVAEMLAVSGAGGGTIDNFLMVPYNLYRGYVPIDSVNLYCDFDPTANNIKFRMHTVDPTDYRVFSYPSKVFEATDWILPAEIGLVSGTPINLPLNGYALEVTGTVPAAGTLSIIEWIT